MLRGFMLAFSRLLPLGAIIFLSAPPPIASTFVLLRLAIGMSVLFQCMYSDYLFGILKLFSQHKPS
jgi:hypothetical protein